MVEPLFEAAALEDGSAVRDDSDDLPGWLRDALARRGLRPHDGWPPVHHLLTERDLPSEPDEDEAVSVSTLHDQLAYDLRPGLTLRYEGRADLRLAHDLYVYFDEIHLGPPRRAIVRRVSPDVLVSFGVSRRHRGSYTVWEESKPPDPRGFGARVEHAQRTALHAVARRVEEERRERVPSAGQLGVGGGEETVRGADVRENLNVQRRP